MTAKSQYRGHIIRYCGEKWINCKTGFAISDNDPCILCGKYPGDGGIDPCLVPIITVLNEGGIETIASCCGHGRRPGSIILKDERELIICRNRKIAKNITNNCPPIVPERKNLKSLKEK